jgi:hypothetical protein
MNNMWTALCQRIFRAKRVRHHQFVAERLVGSNRLARETWGAFIPEDRVTAGDAAAKRRLMAAIYGMVRAEQARLTPGAFVAMLRQTEHALLAVMEWYLDGPGGSDSTAHKLRLSVGLVAALQRSCDE